MYTHTHTHTHTHTLSAEAIHLATMLSKHGFFFCVEGLETPMRDDGTLYRFQVRMSCLLTLHAATVIDTIYYCVTVTHDVG